jgi:hypothetical protein
MPNQEHPEDPTPLLPLAADGEPAIAEAPETPESLDMLLPKPGCMEFRSLLLPELLVWLPVSLWPALLLLCWTNRHAPSAFFLPLLALLPVFWQRGVAFDGGSKSYHTWNGPLFPLFRRFHDYAGLTGVEVRENHWVFSQFLPETARSYLRLELGHYDVVLIHGRAGARSIKRFRNFAAAIVAANQVADFLDLPVQVHQPPR